jgi:hypothetical protein
LPVESPDQKNVPARDGLDPAFGNLDSALPGQPQHGMLYTRVIPPIVRARELRNPERMLILDDRFWTHASHGGSEK